MTRKQRNNIFKTIIVLNLIVFGYVIIAINYNLWPYHQKKLQTENDSVLNNLEPNSQNSDKAQQSTTQVDQQTASKEAPSKYSDQTTLAQSRELIITSQGFNDDGDYEIRASVNNLTSSDARCQLILNDQTLETVDLQFLPRSAVCKGFLINKTSLKPGANRYKIKLVASGYAGEAEGSVKYEQASD